MSNCQIYPELYCYLSSISVVLLITNCVQDSIMSILGKKENTSVDI